ncbi:MAG TPA: NDMA-dependent alcohol dehydrogenase [Aeromicrobium sp.]|nr:NDMA-dependent alcohol dehydrogenase [Aeromicrobium sp.]
MKTRAAVLWTQPGKWEVSEIDIDDPKADEVLVKIHAAGICHTDDHFRTGDLPAAHLPLCGGHEGAGIVEKVGAAVRNVAPGDRVVLSFIPGCGRCRWCASGKQNLCDNGAKLLMGSQLDGTFRMHKDGSDIGQLCLASTFSEYTVVNQDSCVTLDDEISFEEAALLGCAVPTGWGSAVAGAKVEPGDVVIVMGVGGVGHFAVQGAAHAGATAVIAVDPVPFKRESALTVGATHACATIAEAIEIAAPLTNGQGADSAIVTIGVVRPEHLGEAFSAVRKAGTLVVTGVGRADSVGLPVSIMELAMFEKRIQGICYGSLSPSKDVPRLLSMRRAGQLKLKELITRTYTLDEVNEAYDDMHAGLNIRGVIVMP